MRFFIAAFCLWPFVTAAQEAEPPITRADTAYQMAQTVQNSGAAQAVQQIALRLALKEDGLEELAIERRDLTEQVEAFRQSNDVPEQERRQRSEQLDTALLVNSRALAAAFPGYLDIVAPAPMSIAETQSLLAPDEALVQFHQGRNWLSIFFIGKQHVIWHRVPVTQIDAQELVQLYREGMGLDGTLRAAAALDDFDDEPDTPEGVFNMGLSAILYQWLFAPYAWEMQQYKHLMIVADKAWIGLPFATLLSDSNDGDRAPTAPVLRKASWMARDHAMTMLPSAVSLRTARAAQADRQNQTGPETTLLAIGDPIFSGAATTDAVVRAAQNGVVDASALLPLPGTRREVRAIAAQFGADRSEVLLGADASEAGLRATDFSTRDVIVFATHGLISGELQGLSEPALALTPPSDITPETRSSGNDGLLTAGEIAGLTLSADWVVLSACNTAAGNGEGAEGLSGLARAFFAAGAQALLVSHWPVRDDAAARLTSSAFANLETSPAMRRAEAMRLAMLELLSDPSDDTLAQPSAWAPFFVVGG